MKTAETEGVLSHGLRVAVRPMRAGDRADLVAGFQRLSEETRYRRFMRSKPRLTSAEVQHLFETDELAMVLVWPRTTSEDVVLGIAHALRLHDQSDTAEFSITVADEIQGCGGGRLLTEALGREARHEGIEYLTGYMLASNEAPARLLAGVGEVVEDRCASGAREMKVRL
ncbi:MAG: hypothetical protein R2720_08320 [Candidatus Nanopelagicales bacterium]